MTFQSLEGPSPFKTFLGQIQRFDAGEALIPEKPQHVTNL